jgi:hypothetical protein
MPETLYLFDNLCKVSKFKCLDNLQCQKMVLFMVGLDDVLGFPYMMFTLEFKCGFTSSLYKPLPFTFVPFKKMVYVFMFLTKHVLGRNYLEFAMAFIVNSFFLCLVHKSS